MKVVLLKDVKDMGRAHTEVEVADGHALNFLIPRKMAVLATAVARTEASTRVKQVIDRKELDVKLVEERLQQLAEEKVTIIKKANDQGHLYDGVDAREIAVASALPLEAIKLEKPIKEIGTFEIAVSYGENFGKFSLEIVPE